MVGVRVRVRVRVRVSRLDQRAGYVQGYIYMAILTVHMVVVRLGWLWFYSLWRTVLTMAQRTYYGEPYLLWRTVLTLAHRTYYGEPYLLWRTVLTMAHRTGRRE
jgi:hypothetical protein